MICRQYSSRFGKNQPEIQVILGTAAQFSLIVVKPHEARTFRANSQVIDNATLYLAAILHYLPVQLEPGQVDEVVIVSDSYFTVPEIDRGKIHVLIDAFDFPESRLNAPVRKYDAVEIEISARRHIGRAVITAISPVWRALFVVLEQALVDPVPDEATHENVVSVDDIPVIDQIASTVAHRVGVFDQHKRAVVVCLCILFQVPVSPVHARMKIRMTFADFLDVSFGFVLHWT